MTREATRNREGILLATGTAVVVTGVDVSEGVIDSVADSRITDLVLVLSLFKPPKGRLVTVTATLFRERDGDSASTRLESTSTGGGGVVGSLTSG